MPRRLLLSSLLCCGLVQAENLSANRTLEANADSFTQALEQGQVDLNFTAQVGWIHEQNLRTGQANTLGSKLTYESAGLKSLWGLIEFANTSAFFKDHHNSGAAITPSKAAYPVIADAQGTAMTRGLLGYDGLPGNQFIFGRQYIKLDNQRFVGSDDERLMPRTFDGFTWSNQSWPDITLFYGFVTEMQTPYQGFSKNLGRESLNAHLFNASWQVYSLGTLTGYGYGIKDKDNGAFSSNTIGGRLQGSQAISIFNFLYALEYAYQRAAHNNALRYYASLQSVEAGWQWEPVTLKVGYDVLTGDENRANRSFQRALGAKNGAFYGLAGQFDTTPTQGLAAASVGLQALLWETSLEATLFSLHPEAGNGSRYGHEWDIAVGRAFLDHYKALVQYSRTHRYDAASPMRTGNKINFRLQAHF